MKKVFHYLKSYAWILILCVLLLFGQAMCDLSLPNLMSNIVNVGIQQGGIEEQAPYVISEDGFQLVSLFLSDSDRQTLQDSYQLYETGTQQAEQQQDAYPILKKQNAYLLKEGAEEAAGSVYGKSAYAMMLFAQDMAQEQGQTQTEDAATSSAEMDMTEIYASLPMLQQLPKESFQQYIDAAAGADSSLTQQVGTAMTRSFYKEAGLDTGSIC